MRLKVFTLGNCLIRSPTSGRSEMLPDGPRVALALPPRRSSLPTWRSTCRDRVLGCHVLEGLRVGAWVRYMDDRLLFASNKHEVRQWADETAEFVHQQLGLCLRHAATVIAPVRVGIPFLGFRIWPRQVRLDAARVRRLRRRLRELERVGPPEARARLAESLFAWAEQADTLRLRRSFLQGRLP